MRRARFAASLLLAGLLEGSCLGPDGPTDVGGNGGVEVSIGLLDEADTDDMLTWQGSGGFSVDASVRIQGEDRAGIERLVRYCARPPFALERLHAIEGGIGIGHSAVNVRALDAIHVATAEVLVAAAGGEALEFWTHDDRQATAAMSRALNVRGT